MARKSASAGATLPPSDDIDDGLAPAPLTNAPLFLVHPTPPVAPISSIDLTGKPKLVFVAGPGNTGKTLICRLIAERSLDREGAELVTVDPLNRELVRF